MGHLIDWASNNHQRFVRAALQPNLDFPDSRIQALGSICAHQSREACIGEPNGRILRGTNCEIMGWIRKWTVWPLNSFAVSGSLLGELGRLRSAVHRIPSTHCLHPRSAFPQTHCLHRSSARDSVVAKLIVSEATHA